MKRLLPILLACLCAGCVHTSSRARQAGFSGFADEPTSNEFAIVVNVFADGRLELFGRRYDRRGLADKLIDAQGGVVSDESRMIGLKGNEGVRFRELESLQEYLLSRRLYRVSIETPRTASVRGTGVTGPILPGGQLEVQILDPDDPIVRALDE